MRSRGDLRKSVQGTGVRNVEGEAKVRRARQSQCSRPRSWGTCSECSESEGRTHWADRVLCELVKGKPRESSTKSLLGCSNAQHSCTFCPHRALSAGASPESVLTAWNMTTYGVSACLGSRPTPVTSLNSLEDDSGERWAV